MNYFFVDASAWVKHCYQEPGSVRVDELINRLLSSQPSRLLFSGLGLTETASIINRYHNARQIPRKTFQQSIAQLAKDAARMQSIPIDDKIIERSLPLLLRHNLNASDALYLQQILDWEVRNDSTNDRIVLVATDRRLLRAAEREGLKVLNPEQVSEAEIDTLIEPC